MTRHYVSRGVVAWNVSRGTCDVSRETVGPSPTCATVCDTGGGRVVRPGSL